MAVGCVQPHAGSCQQLFCVLGRMLGSFLLSWRLWEHLVLSQAAGAKQPLFSLAGQASLQAPLQRGPLPPMSLVYLCHLLLQTNSPRAVLPAAGGSQSAEAVSGLGQQSENHLAFLS